MTVQTSDAIQINLKKAANLLVILGPEYAEKLLCSFTPQEVERITTYVNEVTSLSASEVRDVIKECYHDCVD